MGESISSRLLKRVTAEQVNTTGPPRTSPSRSRPHFAINNRVQQQIAIIEEAAIRMRPATNPNFVL
ncbi:hypothetical protein ACU4GD_14965 [Cupriavidus basilensis]